MMMAYTVTNPYTKEVIASYEVASQAEVDQALQRAQAYYLATKGQPVEKRAQKLLKLADLMEERKEQLAKTASLSMGKLIGQARSEVDLCLEILRYYAVRGPQMLRAKPTCMEQDKRPFCTMRPVELSWRLNHGIFLIRK